MSVPPRRIVTGHDASGSSVVLSDTATPRTLDIGSAAFHEIWITDRTPSPIAASEPEPTDRPVRTPPPAGGVLVRFTEMGPGAESPMHRTETIDVGVVLEVRRGCCSTTGPRRASAPVTRSFSAARTTPGRIGPTAPFG
jgi:hypothetical protein